MPNSHTLDQNLQRLITARTSIANAIVQKGGTVSQGDGFEDFPDDIATISANQPIVPEKIEYLRQQAVQPKGFYFVNFTEKSWAGLTSFEGSYVWTDGTDIYYSGGSSSTQYVLDKETSAWNTKTWIGQTLRGDYIWSDGTDIYYSNNNAQKVLDKATSTWNTKTWSGLTSFNASNVWTDGTDIYYSSGSSQYVLDKSTSTLNTKTWSGLTSFNGQYVWTDGTNIYYSYSGSNYVLDKATSTWSTKTWSGLTDFYGIDIWTDGTNIYCANFTGNGKPYICVLNKSTSTWKSIYLNLSNGIAIKGRNFWSDGTDIYHDSNNSNQYRMTLQYIEPSSDPISIKTTKCILGYNS